MAGPQGVVGPIPKNRAVLEAVRGYVMSGGDAESLVPLLGASSFRSLPSELEGDELWAAFAVAHGLDERRRRLWFVDHPIHAGGRTWLLANNVWGPRTHGVLRDLVTSAGGTVTVTQPNGSRLKPFDNGEGMQVLPPGTPLPPKRPLPGRSAADDPSWSSEDRSLLATLVAQDAAWERVGPGEGLGSWTLQVAAGLVDQGLRVRPLMDLELSDAGLEHLSPARLAATHGDRTVYAFTDDHGQDDHTWARLKQRLGPYAESPAVDRVLADFSVHGPFERHVVREHGRVSVVVLVRLDDVQVALQDLVNVASSLDSALREAASTS